MTTKSLPHSGFLSEASDELNRLLESLSSEVRLKTGEVLFEQGDDGDALYAIVAGALEISVLSLDGRKLTLDVMREGALFGEIALFDPGVRTATVGALECSVLRRLRNADVMRAVRAKPDLAADLIRLAGQRMRWMNRQLSEQVFLPVPTRLARKVLYLIPVQPDQPAVLSLSQAELAEFVGATREAISKTLSAWKRSQVIRLSRGGLEVLDRDALRALAEFDRL
jgi:CRP/FNR family transcriptional regulator, cyclic AMP receptor protein